MKLREPGICRVDVSQGELIGATNRYVKTFADLERLYEDRGVVLDDVEKETTESARHGSPRFEPLQRREPRRRSTGSVTHQAQHVLMAQEPRVHEDQLLDVG